MIVSDDLLKGDSLILNVNLAMSGVLPSIPSQTVTLMAIQDDLIESEECLVFSLSIIETALDPRDRGQVDIARTVALLRIQDPALMCTQDRSLVSTILLNCEANFPFDEVSCSFDGAPLQSCKWIWLYSTIKLNHSTVYRQETIPLHKCIHTLG